MDFWRQEDIIPSGVLREASVTLIGAGGIGSPTALALAKMGIGELHIYDGDSIEPHNLPNQLYMIEDDGELKVNALRKNLLNYVNSCRIFTHEEHYDGQPLKGIVISAVDNMEARSMIFSNVKKHKPDFYIEGRMGAEMMRIYSVNPREDTLWYEKTLYSDGDAMELPCTAQSIMYNVFVIGGLIASQTKKALMKEEMAREIIFDLVTMTLLLE
jgi:sulfur carrier protein ThiS adenylyltransferase